MQHVRGWAVRAAEFSWGKAHLFLAQEGQLGWWVNDEILVVRMLQMTLVGHNLAGVFFWSGSRINALGSGFLFAVGFVPFSVSSFNRAGSQQGSSAAPFTCW